MLHIAKKVVGSLLLVAVVVAGGGLLYTQATGGKLFSVQSGSMAPSYNKGDLVSVSSISGSSVSAGDVVTFINPNNIAQTITHRVLANPGDGTLVTKGDANNAADSPIPASSVVGKVSASVPFAGYGIDFIRQPLGLLLLIYVPALLVVIDELRRLSRHFERRNIYFRVPDLRKRLGSKLPKERAASVLRNGLFIIAVVGFVTLPTYAALTAQATLAGNTISVNGEGQAEPSSILLRRVSFQCTPDNTATASRLVEILVHNTGDQDVLATGWTVRSSNGTIASFTPGTLFDAIDDYDIEPDLQYDVDYAGDYLALFDDNDQLIDAISWGDDTTYLNPSLPEASEGLEFRRVSLITNTSSTIDWSVNARSCQ